MKRVLIIKNCSREGPGLFECILKEHEIPFLVIDVERGEIFPSPEGFGALILLGGPQSANDSSRQMVLGLKRVKEALDLKVPVLGICLGLQMLVKALGGKVIRNRIREIGFRDPEGHFFEIKLTDDGTQDPLMKSLDNPFKIFHLHGETVNLTPEMKRLGEGQYCSNQVVKAAPLAFGVQGHLELTEDLFRLWIRRDPDLLKLSKFSLEKDYLLIQSELSETGRRLFINFLQLASLP